MDNEQASAEYQDIVHNSLADAVSAMPDIEGLEQGLSVDRAEDGKFKSRKEAPAEAEPDQDLEALADEDEAAEVEPATPAEDDDSEDYIELEADEEGGEPVRIKLEEAVQRYREYEQLQEELEHARTTQPPPEEYIQVTDQYISRLTQLEDNITSWMHFNVPQAPDERLLDEMNPNYNPPLYNAQLQEYRARRANYEDAMQKLQYARTARTAEQQRLDQAQAQRFQSQFLQKHPHMTSQAARRELAEALEQSYGVTPEMLNSIRHSGLADALMDAYAFRKSQAATKKVAKAVKAKPKLVKSQRQAGSNSKQGQYNRLASREHSGTIDEAADRIGALLNI
jgi:hypothetical protein